MNELVDREPQLETLRALASRDEPVLCLLYGRRRVGKTFLLDHAWPDSQAFYFLATDSTPDVNRLDLLRDWSRWTDEPVIAADFPTWRAVYRALAAEAHRRNGLVVILDEFQYLLGGDDDAASQLAAVWDRDVRGAPLTLVLCGSEVSTMRGLLDTAAPLYGRFTWSHRLKPFDYFDAGRMVADRSDRDKAMVYGIFGGTPLFLSQIRPDEPLDEAVKRLVLDPGGAVRTQLETLLEQERGLREVAEYRASLTAIAMGDRTKSDIANASGLEQRPHVVRRALEGLESLGLIRAEALFESPPNTALRYELDDPALRFWHRFVVRNRSPLELGLSEQVWSSRIAPQLDQYMGRIFERIVRSALVRWHAGLGLSPPDTIGRWEGHDRHRRSIEIDLLARLLDGTLLASEIKWSSQPIGPGVHYTLLRNLEDLAESGRAWAHDVNSETTRFLYVSAAGFDSAFLSLARDDGRILLWDLADLYPAG